MAVEAPPAPSAPTQPNPQATSAALDGARNRARLQQQLAQPPLQMPGTGGQTPATDAGGGELTQAQADASIGRMQAAATTRGMRQLPVAGRAIGAAQRRLAAMARRQSATDRQARGGEPADPDYPNPLTLRTFIGFGFLAISQDVVPAVVDLLIGVGWLVGWIMLPITWSAYFYFIVRRAPRPLKRKFVQRSAMVAMIGMIPYVGEILPEWTATAVAVYIYIARYSRQKAYLAAGQASRSAQRPASRQAEQASQSVSAST